MNIIYFSMLFCFSIIYIIPISSTFNPEISEEHGTVYYYLRLIILPLAMLCFLNSAKIRVAYFIEYNTLIILAISAYLINRELPATSLMLLTSIILYDLIFKEKHCLHRKTIYRYAVAYLAQITLMSFLFLMRHRYLVIINTGKDPNYTAYFLIILYYMLGNELDKKLLQLRDLLLVLSIFTWSRMALLAVVIIYACRIFEFNKSRVSIFITNYPFLIFVIAELLWLLLCKLFVIYFNSYGYVYQFRTGIHRFSTLIDGSNYMRAAMNNFLVDDITWIKLLFGYKKIEYHAAVLNVISRINNPHNTFLAIYIQSGIFFALAIIHRAIRLFYGKPSLCGMYFIYLLYSLILGPSFYYGIELIIWLIAVRTQKENKGD